jgi:hypothetical protein
MIYKFKGKKIEIPQTKHLNKWGWNGSFRIFSISNVTNTPELVKSFPNLLTDAAVNEQKKSLYIYTDDLFIYHLALGNDDTAPTVNDAKLGNEIYRVPKSSEDATTSKVLISEFYVTDSEFSGQIEELGTYGSYDSDDWDGGTGKDTGFLISRVLFSYNKTTSEQLLIQRTDTFSAA